MAKIHFGVKPDIFKYAKTGHLYMFQPSSPPEPPSLSPTSLPPLSPPQTPPPQNPLPPLTPNPLPRKRKGPTLAKTNFGHPELTNLGQSILGQSIFGQSILGFECVCHGVVGPKPKKNRAPREGPEGWVMKNFGQSVFGQSVFDQN